MHIYFILYSFAKLQPSLCHCDLTVTTMHILTVEFNADIWSTHVSQLILNTDRDDSREYKNARHQNTLQARTQELPQQCTWDSFYYLRGPLLYTITGK